MPEIEVVEAEPADAEVMVGLMQAAFGARPPVDPPSEALAESAESVRAALATGTGVLVFVNGEPAATLLIDPTRRAEVDHPADADTVVLRRVSVHPRYQGAGVALHLIHAAEQIAAADGARRVELVARHEFPALIAWWIEQGYRELRAAPHGVVLGRRLPVVVEVPTAEAMQALGERLARVLHAGDLLIASGELGAGKTTFTQGLARGLGVEGPVLSPTFVLSRVHPSSNGGPALVHVDAYRLGSPDEFDDLDLDETYAGSVTLVEWGVGRADHVSADLLHVVIERSIIERSVTERSAAVGSAAEGIVLARDATGGSITDLHDLQSDHLDPDDPAEGADPRLVTVRALGPRWDDVDLHSALSGELDAADAPDVGAQQQETPHQEAPHQEAQHLGAQHG